MRILGSAEVMERTGLGRTTIWRYEKRGDFPRRRRLGANRVGWLESEVNEWVESRPPANGEDARVGAGR